jgi:hypothetical protein
MCRSLQSYLYKYTEFLKHATSMHSAISVELKKKSIIKDCSIKCMYMCNLLIIFTSFFIIYIIIDRTQAAISFFYVLRVWNQLKIKDRSIDLAQSKIRLLGIHCQ